MSNILVTSGGFVSGELVKALEKDPAVGKIVVWTDPADKINTDKTTYTNDPDFENNNYNVIYHTFGCARASAPPDEIWASNVTFTYDLLNMIDQEVPPTFIFLSSIVVENEPTTVYSASKRAGEELVKAYGNLGKIVPYVVRPCMIIGENRKNGLIPDIIRKLKAPGDSIELFGKFPGSRKPLVHVDEVVKLLINCAKDVPAKRTWSICSDNSVSVFGVATSIQSFLKTDKIINWNDVISPTDQLYIQPRSDVNVGTPFDQLTKTLLRMNL